jgi:hypothetical protein
MVMDVPEDDERDTRDDRHFGTSEITSLKFAAAFKDTFHSNPGKWLEKDMS